MGYLTFILGGARSGKSSYAQSLASNRSRRVVYIATAQAQDAEMQARIETHKKSRPSHWTTLEIPRQVASFLNEHPVVAEAILLDCLTLLVSNVLLAECGSDEQPDETRSAQALQDEINPLLNLIKNSPSDWIVVSNEVGMGLVPPFPLGRVYRDLLGKINMQFAAACDEAYLMVAGLALPLHNLIS